MSPQEWEDNCIDDNGTRGCRRLYRVVANNPEEEKWCDGSTIPCDDCEDEVKKGCNLTADDRFSLNRDTSVPLWDVKPEDREWFAWQWYEIMGYMEEYLGKDDKTENPNGSLKRAEGIIKNEQKRLKHT